MNIMFFIMSNKNYLNSSCFLCHSTIFW